MTTHKKGTRWTEAQICEVLESENCKLTSKFTKLTAPIKYTYNDKEYAVMMSDWFSLGARPHLGKDAERIITLKYGAEFAYNWRHRKMK